MINLNHSPQRAEIKAEYTINNDILTVRIGNIEEIFDFTGLEEGIAGEIITEVLTINPIISVEKIGDAVNITVIRFYSEDEKEVFEIGTN